MDALSEFVRTRCAFVFLTTTLLFAGVCEAAPSNRPHEEGLCRQIIKADIVALEQAYVLNRFGSYVPAGMLYALRNDVVSTDGASKLEPGRVQLRANKRPRPLVLRVNEGDCLEVRLTNLLSETHEDEGDALRDNGGRMPAHIGALPGTKTSGRLATAEKVSVDAPRTRAASFHVTGLSTVPIPENECPRDAACGGDGTNVGLPEFQGLAFNPGTPETIRKTFDIGSLAKPRQTVVTRWRADREGAYFAHSMAAPVGGEGDGGQIGLGLFAAVNVEPANSRWYRSQVTHDDLKYVTKERSGDRHPYRDIDYDRERTVGDRPLPVLAMLDKDKNIVSSDLNAIIVLDERSPSRAKNSACEHGAYGSTCNRPFREFTVIFHDEVHAQQAFPELADENNPLHQVRDGMGVNYGVASMGVATLATPHFRALGPLRDCQECRAEEFFLTSWANGDPALVLAYDEKTGAPKGARYPDDPSNVHHSYLGDPVVFRNLHAGPKETHIFHLHAHQWMQDGKNPNSSYLDSQTISPGATFSYAIEFGGSGNRNYTAGDSIFHCHLYSHFAQGMWELWRVHDAFADGKPGLYRPDRPSGPDNDPGMRNLPDGEIADGTQTPAVVPIPSAALAPMPSAAFRGFPFYIPGKAGHRPPQPALDLDVDRTADWVDPTKEPPPELIVDGGLPRHIVTTGTLEPDKDRALAKGGVAAQVIAQRVAKQAPKALETFAESWKTLTIETLPHSGVKSEQDAMKFHEGTLEGTGLKPEDVKESSSSGWWRATRAYRTDNAASTPIQNEKNRPEPLFFVNSRPRAPGAPFADPCPEGTPVRDYRAAFIQTELTYNKHGWFDPQGRIVILENDIKDVIDPNTRSRLPEPLFFRANSGECINFKTSNFVPNALNVDDFQIYTPTDTIGQHIHLVKFDVIASDGSGNGFNYEDATFSPEEVRERIFALRPGVRFKPKAHPLFRKGGDIYEAACRNKNSLKDCLKDERYGALLERGLCPDQELGQSDKDYERMLDEKHPLCGAQTTTQRWWADPIINRATGKDATLRTVFTHDHMGPSSHQQHGLYAGLVIEPPNSIWAPLDVPAVAVRSAVASGKPLRCELPRGSPDRAAICDRLFGGSEVLRLATRDEKADNASSGVREPLRLRSDGGPTSTMANVIAPDCRYDRPPHDDSPDLRLNCATALSTQDTRREFMLAMADFGIAYNMALEPINPEPAGDSGLRDNSAIRFGRRHVAVTPARPLGISSEDPGSQYFNYRHEPLALRLSEAKPDSELGGWNYSQSSRRARLEKPCSAGDQDCIGDPANGFSTAVHALRDEKLAKEPLTIAVSPNTRELLKGTQAGEKLGKVLADVEQWRRDFNCLLYPSSLLPTRDKDHPQGCSERLSARLEPWRTFGDPATPILPAYERDPVQIRLIQGAQEAQHIFTMNGVKWHRLPGSTGGPDDNNSGFVNAQALGISEHFEFDVSVPSLEASHTDYLYFGASVDQLWDGLWGVLRSFSPPREPSSKSSPVTTSAGSVSFEPGKFLAPIREETEFSARGGDKQNVCAEPTDRKETSRHHKFFDISALRVCDLFDSCASASPRGLEYSSRFGIHDQKAIVYVLEDEDYCNAPGKTACDTHASDWSRKRNTTALSRLREEFAAGRPLEPLVLRAAAGQCLHVNLRNLLPALLNDGPTIAANGEKNELLDSQAYHNFLPMITDGFNINQFRMSSSVGLSAPRVAQHPIWADGSNVGLNGAVSVAPVDTRLPGSPFDRGPDAIGRQGSLVPPCTGTEKIDDAYESRCKRSFVWSATDLRFEYENGGAGASYVPVEFGALPLRSFGDPIKQPAHGLVGALVIGPRGSQICERNRFERKRSFPTGESFDIPGGVSAEVCKPDGSRYVDHVLVMQDAVNATRGGFPVPNLSGAEEPDDYGVKAINYKTDPLWARRGDDPSIAFPERNTEFDYSKALSSAVVVDGHAIACAAGIPPILALAHPCDPETPIFDARPGETVRLNIVHPGGHTRQQGLAVSGHSWNPYPWSQNSREFRSEAGSSIRQGVYNGFGPMMGVTLQLSAGGAAKRPGDYLFRSTASFLFDGGTWGVLRVGEPERVPRSPSDKR